jgi:hypothetical protein
LNLRLPKEEFVEGIYFAEYQNDVLLTCEISAGGYGYGFITRLNGKTLKMEWKRLLPGFNVGQALIEGDHSYVTAFGFVGKVSLKSGAFLWSHRDLFRDGDTFNAFELPQVDKEMVLFKEETIYNPPPKTLVIDKKAGKILGIR